MTISTPSHRMAGHLLVECLVAQGVDIAFGVPGESYLAVLDGFHEHSEDIKFVINRQEGGAAYMAEAYGKLTGRPGVCLVTRGPGATNASIGLHTAFQDSTPMVLLVGDVASHTRDRESFQEMDFSAFFGPATKGLAKRVERIDDPNRIPEYIARAFATALHGRPGPAVLVLPEDMLTQQVEMTAHTAPLPQVEPLETWMAPGALQEVRGHLLKAQKPMVIVGGGGWTPQAAQAMQRFAENWKLPVANAFRFQDTFDNLHPQYAGDVGLAINPKLAKRIQESDLLLVLGARLGEITTGGYDMLKPPRLSQKLIHIMAGAEELQRVFFADVAIHASMNAAARSLETLHAPAELAYAAWTQACHLDYLSNLVPQALPGPMDMASVVKCLQHHLPSNAVLSNGAGNFASWLHRFYQYPGLAKGVKTQLAPTNGSMGYGVPAGIAAALASNRLVVTLTGDGDFLMNGQELATAVQFGAKTIVILLNNGMYGTIRMHQEREFPTHVSGSQLQNPDFAALAKAYGYAGVKVRETAEFEPALLSALARPEGTLIEILLDPEVITTRGTLQSITQAALDRQQKTS
ncbi:MAG: thiamine pyrophosphate-binding protein [Betaproteobacteria bacterium]|nr:thiamine pyrophosphate-binding protein [Betaproteobacteria bacterium]